jgi:hypothetical protein
MVKYPEWKSELLTIKYDTRCLRVLAINFPEWREKRNKQYSKMKNCYISNPNNLRLLEFICWIVWKVFESSRQRPPKNKSVQSCRHVFLKANIPKPLSFEGSFHCRKEKKKSLVRDQESRVDDLCPKHRVWSEMASPPCGMGTRTFVQQEWNALFSKLWPHPGNALNNVPITST